MSIHSDLIDFNGAVAAYLASGENLQQPSVQHSELIESARPTWILRNVNGVLARVDAVSGRVHHS